MEHEPLRADELTGLTHRAVQCLIAKDILSQEDLMADLARQGVSAELAFRLKVAFDQAPNPDCKREKIVKRNHTVHWNALAETRSAHESGTRELQTDALRGYALDYALADLCDVPVVELRYLSPDFRIAEVWAEDPQQQLGLRRWSPSSDPVLAEKVVVKLNGSIAAPDQWDMIERLRSIVLTKCGPIVFIPFPVPKK